MLLACDACHRQYDVGELPLGAKVRCVCARLLTVPPPRTKSARMLHCSNCGGKLVEGATSCEYCQAGVARDGLGDTCPECFARLVSGARYCSTCGVEIAPESVLKTVSTQTCPRCSGTLAICEVEDGGRFTECTSCAGLWLAEDVFEGLTRARDRQAAPAWVAARQRPGTPTDAGPVRYLPCPVCGELMNRRNFGGRSGIILDWCRGHGFWFDADELERVLAFVAAGGLERQRDAALENLRDERERERRRRIAAESHALRDLGRPRGPNLLDWLGNVIDAFL